jgi:uncharacterized protein YecT (DUF1311 family)
MPRNEDSPVDRPGRRLNPTLLALLGGGVILLALVAYFATSRNSDQDKLGGNAVTETQAGKPEKRCASQATYDLIKRELFRRAAQLRGSDQAAYDKLSAYSVVRMENPVLESEDKDTGGVNCSGSLSLDLPPGVAVVGGRHTLMSDVDYTMQPAADGSGNVVLLRNADAIIAPLATLARVGQAAPAAPAEANAVAPQQPQTTAPISQPAPPPTAAPAPPPSAGRPSFDCSRARTRGEAAVCSDAGLSALDRNMAAQYIRSMSGASPEQQVLLRRTRDRFLAYRDRCPDRKCVGDAYVGRMREIRDIMEGHWRGR